MSDEVQAAKMALVRDHLAQCRKCAHAWDAKLRSYRVNDFCDRGRFLFAQWAENARPIAATVLDEQTSQRVIEQELERTRKSGMN